MLSWSVFIEVLLSCKARINRRNSFCLLSRWDVQEGDKDDSGARVFWQGGLGDSNIPLLAGQGHIWRILCEQFCKETTRIALDLGVSWDSTCSQTEGGMWFPIHTEIRSYVQGYEDVLRFVWRVQTAERSKTTWHRLQCGSAHKWSLAKPSEGIDHSVHLT